MLLSSTPTGLSSEPNLKASAKKEWYPAVPLFLFMIDRYSMDSYWVVHIIPMGDPPQILGRVIQAIAIDMVNLSALKPFATNLGERMGYKAMDKNMLFIVVFTQPYEKVSHFMHRALKNPLFMQPYGTIQTEHGKFQRFYPT